MLPHLMLALGLAVLTLGADLLVRGAAALAAAARVPPLVIGLTVVAFGTSAPELVVSVQSALRDQGDIALGNVLGSNIFNVLFILGLSALITPLAVSRQLIRLDVPLMIAVSVIVYLLAADGRIGRLDGLLLAGGLAGYTIWTFLAGRRSQAAGELSKTDMLEHIAVRPTLASVIGHVVLTAAGLAMLVLGARWFCDAAVEIARAMAVSELVIGLTIVAAGTSLPEVATSVVAALRGQRDIAVGNIIGSNLFNLLGVLGISAAVAGGIPVGPAALQLSFPVMVAVAVACLPVFFTGQTIARWEGGLFLAYYIAYTTYLVLAASESPSGEAFGLVMLAVVVPLTAITLLITIMRAAHIRPRASSAE